MMKKSHFRIICYIKEYTNIVNNSLIQHDGSYFTSQYYEVGIVRFVIDDKNYFNIFTSPFIGIMKSNDISKMLNDVIMEFLV